MTQLDDMIKKQKEDLHLEDKEPIKEEVIKREPIKEIVREEPKPIKKKHPLERTRYNQIKKTTIVKLPGTYDDDDDEEDDDDEYLETYHSESGVSGLGSPIMALFGIGLTLVIAFIIFGGIQQKTETTTSNVTIDTFINPIVDITGWIPIFVIITIGAIFMMTVSRTLFRI